MNQANAFRSLSALTSWDITLGSRIHLGAKKAAKPCLLYALESTVLLSASTSPPRLVSFSLPLPSFSSQSPALFRLYDSSGGYLQLDMGPEEVPNKHLLNE